MQTEEQNLVNLPGLSRALRLPAQWLKEEADAGGIPCLRVGRRRLFSLPAVKAVLVERAATTRNGGAR
jgi:hypothetical protein